MGDVFGAIIAAAFFSYAVFCMIMIPALLLEGRADERECARVHQVFACELGPWVPVNPEAPQ